MDTKELLETNGINTDDDEIVEIDGFQDAIVGITDDSILIYSYEKMVEVMVNKGEDAIDAMDYIDYNILRFASYISRHPIIMYEVKHGT